MVARTTIRPAIAALSLFTVAITPACYWFADCPDDSADSYEEAVVHHAEDDLACKVGDVSVRIVRDSNGSMTGHAEGCSKTATYDCRSAGRSCGVRCSLRGNVTLR